MVPGWWAGDEAGVVDAVSSGVPSWLPEIGATGLLAVVVIMVLTGRLVPGREMRYWREAFFEQQRQNHALMETGRVTQDVLKALPEAVRGDST